MAAVAGLLLVYGFHGNYRDVETLSHDVGALYYACGRAAWGAVCAWVCFACGHGYGGEFRIALGGPRVVDDFYKI